MSYTLQDERGYFIIHDNGNIERTDMAFTPSGQWKLRGIRNVKCTSLFIPFEKLGEFIARNPEWTFKNGKGKWRVCDLDHGTWREWGSRIVRISVRSGGASC